MTLEIKQQTWNDDLRLPCLTNPTDSTALLQELETLRKPPIPFQSKHVPALKRNKWFVLKRNKGRRGLLVIWPAAQCCVYISGDAPHKRFGLRIALIRVRIDPTFLEEGAGLTVFAATLSAESRTLSIEDALLWKGRNLLQEETFSKRWTHVVQWIEHYCIVDTRLVGGLVIQAANWEPLAVLRPSGVWMLQSDEPSRVVLLLIAQNNPSPPRKAAVEIKAPVLETGPLVAVATRDVGPEQWALASADGVSLGRALIRRLAVSQSLRSVKGVITRVRVEWTPQFQKWEICELTDSSARHSSAFLPM